MRVRAVSCYSVTTFNVMYEYHLNIVPELPVDKNRTGIHPSYNMGVVWAKTFAPILSGEVCLGGRLSHGLV